MRHLTLRLVHELGGDEIAVVETLAMADLGVPVLLQASNDTIDKVDLAGRRDAFCGKISVTANLYQYGIPWTDTTSHTSDLDGEEFVYDKAKVDA